MMQWYCNIMSLDTYPALQSRARETLMVEILRDEVLYLSITCEAPSKHLSNSFAVRSQRLGPSLYPP